MTKRTADKKIPPAFQNDPQFLHYQQIWSQNEGSIVFVPLAEILRRGGYLDEARELCEKGLKYNPDSVSGRLILASLYSEQGRSNDADRLAREILQRMPDHTGAREFLLSEGAEPTLPDFDAASNGPPIIDETWQTATMAGILERQGEYEEAARIIRALLSEKPQDQTLQRRLVHLEKHIKTEVTIS